MQQIGIFGGTFNPIHNGHIELARRLLSLAGLDEVWFVVSPQNPFKRNDVLLDDALRLEMVRLALEGEPHLVPCDYDPDREFVLLIGADNWARFDEWYASREIIAHHRIVVYPREGSPLAASSLPPGVTLADTGLVSGSSTEVRRRIAAGQPIDGLVPQVVAEFIRSKNLYV